MSVIPGSSRFVLGPDGLAEGTRLRPGRQTLAALDDRGALMWASAKRFNRAVVGVCCIAAVLAAGASATRAADPTSVVATITVPSSVTTGVSTCIGVHLADATTGQPVLARLVAVNVERLGTSLPLGTDQPPQGPTDASGNGSFCWTPQFLGMIQLDASGLVVLEDGFVTATSNTIIQTVTPPPFPPGPPVTIGTGADSLTLTAAAANVTASVGAADSVTIVAGAPGRIGFNATTLSVASFPSWISASSVETSQGSCSTAADGTISCAFGVLQAGTQATVTLSVLAGAAGQLNVSASASGYPTGGYLPTGNSATTSTTITFAQPAPPVTTPTITSSAKHTTVNRRCHVPKLVGDTVAQARTAITKAGCVPAKIVHKATETKARRGRVISQLPRPRASLRPGASITLTPGAATG